LLRRLGDCVELSLNLVGLVLRQHILIAKLTQTAVQIFSPTTYGWAGCHTVWGNLRLLVGWWRRCIFLEGNMPKAKQNVRSNEAIIH
jgi:hypothetical protein